MTTLPLCRLTAAGFVVQDSRPVARRRRRRRQQPACPQRADDSHQDVEEQPVPGVGSHDEAGPLQRNPAVPGDAEPCGSTD